MGLFPNTVWGSSMGLFPTGHTSRTQLVTGVWTAGKNFFMRCVQFNKIFQDWSCTRKWWLNTPLQQSAPDRLMTENLSASNLDVAFHLHHSICWSISAGPPSCRYDDPFSIKHAHIRKSSEDKLPGFRITVTLQVYSNHKITTVQWYVP